MPVLLAASVLRSCATGALFRSTFVRTSHVTNRGIGVTVTFLLVVSKLERGFDPEIIMVVAADILRIEVKGIIAVGTRIPVC